MTNIHLIVVIPSDIHVYLGHAFSSCSPIALANTVDIYNKVSYERGRPTSDFEVIVR